MRPWKELILEQCLTLDIGRINVGELLVYGEAVHELLIPSGSLFGTWNRSLPIYILLELIQTVLTISWNILWLLFSSMQLFLFSLLLSTKIHILFSSEYAKPICKLREYDWKVSVFAKFVYCPFEMSVQETG